MNRFAILLCCCLMMSTPFSWAESTEIQTTLEDQQSVAVTIYNDDLALVRDQRFLAIPSGEQILAIREVSGRMRPETVLLAADNLHVIEQNFEYDLLTPQAMLEKYVGREVAVVKTHPTTGEEEVIPAQVLSAANGVVLRVGDTIETGVPGRLVFSDVPANLRDKPTLTMLVDSKGDENQEIELSYLTGGLSWKADYVAELSGDDSRLDLSGWVTLNNQSGATYKDARLKLVAGDVHRARDPREYRRVEKMLMAEAAVDSGMKEEAFFEYHLYSLARQTTIRDKQSKQVSLLQARGAAVDKQFVLQGADYYYRGRTGEIGRKLKVGVFITIKNEKETGLGIPLPRGVVRVYKKDSAGSLQFVGEDRIDHTPENEIIRLKLGNAFDVTGNKKQTDFKKITGFSRYNYVFESSYSIELKNAKEEEVVVRVVEPIPGDWEIMEESLAHKKEASNIAAWSVAVPAKGSTVLTYRVRVKY